MHLNEAPAGGGSVLYSGRKPVSTESSCRGVVWSGTASAAQSQPSSNLQVFESSCRGVVWHGWRFFCCTLSAIFKSSSVLLGNIGGFPHHDITLMATLTIKQQLESKKLFLFVKRKPCWDHFDHKQHLRQDGRYSIQECRQRWRWVSIYSVFIVLLCYMLSVSIYIIFISKAQHLSTSKMMEVAFLLWKKSLSKGLLIGASDNKRFCQNNSRLQVFRFSKLNLNNVQTS